MSRSPPVGRYLSPGKSSSRVKLNGKLNNDQIDIPQQKIEFDEDDRKIIEKLMAEDNYSNFFG